MLSPLNKILDKLTCISCMSGNLARVGPKVLMCENCGCSFRIIDDIPCFVPSDLINFSEVSSDKRNSFLCMKKTAYSENSFAGRLYNHYHRYASSMRASLSKDIVTLDIGSGVGEHYPFISEREKAEFRFIALDIDRFKLGYFHACHPEIPLIQGSALSLPFGDAQFDVVQLLATLEHFDTNGITAVLNESLRVLRPGGCLLVAYPAEGSLLLKVGQLFMHWFLRLKTGFDLEREEVHQHYSSARGIQTILLAVPGLSLCESNYYPLNIKNIQLSLFLNEMYRKELT